MSHTVGHLSCRKRCDSNPPGDGDGARPAHDVSIAAPGPVEGAAFLRDRDPIPIASRRCLQSMFENQLRGALRYAPKPGRAGKVLAGPDRMRPRSSHGETATSIFRGFRGQSDARASVIGPLAPMGRHFDRVRLGL